MLPLRCQQSTDHYIQQYPYQKQNHMQMKQLLEENQQLRIMAAKYEKQVEDLQQIQVQHQNQIDTLLKFNQKLLGIIEKQLNGQKLKNSDILSLQPISQKTQVQSEMFQSQLTTSPIININTQRLLQKKSLNLKPDPMYERINRPEPLIILQKQEHMSIDVDGREEQDESDQIGGLLEEYHRNIFNRSGSFQIDEYSKREDIEQLYAFREETENETQKMFQKLVNFKNKIGSTMPQERLTQILQQMPISLPVKNYLSKTIASISVE